MVRSDDWARAAVVVRVAAATRKHRRKVRAFIILSDSFR
jgi:hypothetical protein